MKDTSNVEDSSTLGIYREFLWSTLKAAVSIRASSLCPIRLALIFLLSEYYPQEAVHNFLQDLPMRAPRPVKGEGEHVSHT